jgi:hypothetical protein
MRTASLLILLGVAALTSPAAVLGAAPKITPAAVLAPACEAHIAAVLQKVDASALPVKVLADPAPKVGPYVTAGQHGFGGVRADTVLTGTVEYQDGATRVTAPFFCVGKGAKAAYYYASRARGDMADRPILPVQQCYEQFKGNAAGASGCIKDVLSGTDATLASAVAAAKARAAQSGGDEPKNFEASELQFETYRAKSCSVFKAVDASTDAADFLNACLARLNQMRANTLNGAVK